MTAASKANLILLTLVGATHLSRIGNYMMMTELSKYAGLNGDSYAGRSPLFVANNADHLRCPPPPGLYDR